MLAIKHHPDEWSVRCSFTKEHGIEIFKGVVNDFDFLKLCPCHVLNRVKK